jgi:hypothetical protein
VIIAKELDNLLKALGILVTRYGLDNLHLFVHVHDVRIAHLTVEQGGSQLVVTLDVPGPRT